jgi:site-specific DNA-cytosine methylase
VALAGCRSDCAGFDIVGAFDLWSEVVDTYSRDIGHVRELPLTGILMAGQAVATLHPDLMCGGSPGQDLSAAGRRTEGQRSELLIAYSMIAAIACSE